MEIVEIELALKHFLAELLNIQLTAARNAPITIKSKPSQLTFEYFSFRMITAKITASGMLSLSIGAILEMLPI
jgi:hypothetical protein